MDNLITLSKLKEDVKSFCEDRDWDQFHNQKDLAIGIITESAELLEHFRFKNKSEMMDMLNEPDKKIRIEEELADILFFVLRFAQMNNIDLSEALKRKIEINNTKYPVDKFKGSNKKYSE